MQTLADISDLDNNDPILDWSLFVLARPDNAALIDDAFTDGISSDLMDAMANVSRFLCRGDVNNALMVAQKWQQRIETHRDEALVKLAENWPPPAVRPARPARPSNGLSADTARQERAGDYDEAFEGWR